MKLIANGAGEQCLRGLMKFALTLLGVLAASASQALAQQASKNMHAALPVVAVTYDLEDAKGALIGGDFWLQGGSVDIAVPFYRGLSVAGNFSGVHASNAIHPGVNLGKISYLAGPRYTLARSSHVRIFGEGLFGGAHGFDSIFPVGGSLVPTANSFAMQLGGGMDVSLHRGFGVRAIELDYVRTGLPNNGANSQNDLRLAFGISYQFERK
jgi:peptidoglycan-associated lipoprotein